MQNEVKFNTVYLPPFLKSGEVRFTPLVTQNVKQNVQQKFYLVLERHLHLVLAGLSLYYEINT